MVDPKIASGSDVFFTKVVISLAAKLLLGGFFHLL
jgi:hypothetical protein